MVKRKQLLTEEERREMVRYISETNEMGFPYTTLFAILRHNGFPNMRPSTFSRYLSGNIPGGNRDRVIICAEQACRNFRAFYDSEMN